jgi:hypothetical protein
LLNRITLGPAQHETYRVDLDGIERAQVAVQFGGGTLDVRPAGTALLDAEFTFNLDGLEPNADYEVVDGRAKLVLQQDLDRVVWQPSAEFRNEWRLHFTDQIPLEMDFTVGASQGTIELGGLRLSHLQLDCGAADLKVRFGAPNPESMASMAIRSGAARLELVGLGNAAAQDLVFDGGLGSYTFDFGGQWRRSMTAHIAAGASEVMLRVPRDIGVQVCPGDLSRGDFGGLHRSGNCYVNEQYPEAEIRLEIEMELGLGDLRIDQISGE